MALTTKQEMFCIEVIKQDTLSAAYRIAYDSKNMSDKTINEKASLLMKEGKITTRVNELRKKVEKKELYTIGESVKRDLNLIRTYESALIVLQDPKAETKEITAAERTIRHIGASGYNSAQERLSKQHGFFEKDNKGKQPINNNIISLGTGKNPNETTD